MEYEYALAKGKPVIAFLHEHPGELKANRTEQTDEGRKALDDFRQLAQKKLCKFWSSADQLGSVVSRSMVQLIRTKPAVGWVRADLAVNESASQEILRLLRRVEELEKEVKQRSDQPPAGAEKLAQGDDEIELHFVFYSEHGTLLTTDNALRRRRMRMGTNEIWRCNYDAALAITRPNVD